MFITKKALSRRTVLRGVGATVALPFMDAMVPALTAFSKTAADPVRRLGFVYIPNGAVLDQWFPKTVGAAFELSPVLTPLASFKEQLLVLSGLDNLAADSRGEGVGDHPRSTAAWLTGVHANDRQPGVEVRL